MTYLPYTLKLPDDSSAMLFWRAMCDRSDERLHDHLRAVGGLYDADMHGATLRRLIHLSAYCRRRYWKAFDERNQARREAALTPQD